MERKRAREEGGEEEGDIVNDDKDGFKDFEKSIEKDEGKEKEGKQEKEHNKETEISNTTQTEVVQKRRCVKANELYKLRWIKKYNRDVGRFKNYEDAVAYFVVSAEIREGECLEIPSFESIRKRCALWRCSFGHEFSSTIARVGTTTKEDFCSVCYRMRSAKRRRKMMKGIPVMTTNLSEEAFMDEDEISNSEEAEQEMLFQQAKNDFEKKQRSNSDASTVDIEQDAGMVPNPKAIDPYQVLGLPLGASSFQIKSRFHELALKYHPDKLKEGEHYDESFFAFTSFRKAYEVLMRANR